MIPMAKGVMNSEWRIQNSETVHRQGLARWPIGCAGIAKDEFGNARRTAGGRPRCVPFAILNSPFAIPGLL